MCSATPLHFFNSFTQCFLLRFPHISALCIRVSVAFSPLLQCVGAGNVWQGQHKETEERRKKSDTAIYRSVTSLTWITLLFPGNVNPTTPTRQTILSESINFGVCLRKLAPADVMHLAAPPGQRVYGRERAGRRQSWQQEGEGSHKVATRSRRLACLSRVNIGPRLHTVMTNIGGRAQKHYQDYCPVLTDPTHAIPIVFKTSTALWHWRHGHV